MKRQLLPFVLLIGLSFPAFAQTDTAKLTQYFQSLEKNNKAMVSVFLSRHDTIVYQKAIGYTDYENKKTANVYSLYRIGSISKMFTAVMILQLVEEKKLKLEDKLSTFFPGIKNSDKITIEQLLNHRSGIANFTNQADYASYMQKPQSEADMLRICESMDSEFEPGSRFNYSNSNYVLLTLILNRVTKSDYASALRKRICAKAGLADTRVGGAINPNANEALSYDFENEKWERSTETDMSVPGGAGNIVSTAKDLCVFVKALFDGKLISKHMLEKMKLIQGGYGYGMLQFPFGARKFYGHSGGIDGFQSMLGYNEDDQTAMCILGNGYNYAINNIAIALLTVNYGQAFTLPDFEKKPQSAIQSKSPEGTYSNEKINMKISVFNRDGNLMAQASGQQAFPLTKVSELEYHFVEGGIQLNFVKEKDENLSGFKLLQGGMELLFIRE